MHGRLPAGQYKLVRQPYKSRQTQPVILYANDTIGIESFVIGADRVVLAREMEKESQTHRRRSWEKLEEGRGGDGP